MNLLSPDASVIFFKEKKKFYGSVRLSYFPLTSWLSSTTLHTYITMIEMTAGAKLSQHAQLKAYTQLIHPAVTLIQ